jgi:hypothetical protein
VGQHQLRTVLHAQQHPVPLRTPSRCRNAAMRCAAISSAR